ncbi:hypothetical protein HanXRQr2_Chr14g0648181 [Helianthus annuus]|uniref:Uncharacterized protein n=1 Tax=Helianthus annuus TaxID=4232 RepID=A0A9K3E9H7_HELAN|nr:hypothetical protein HanXRQr2_Chr14g0648181 [Helianthus annuus]KAJ0840706.1 hypothetical protein HanPSC8_Chr14g0621981 [Helianthus annuus]
MEVQRGHPPPWRWPMGWLMVGSKGQRPWRGSSCLTNTKKFNFPLLILEITSNMFDW